jgi:type I restriction enzyme M protein
MNIKRTALLAEDAAAAEDRRVSGRQHSGCRRRGVGRTFRPTPSSLIGKLIDEAMPAIEVANPGLKGVLPKDYNRPALDKARRTDRPRLQ